MGRLLDRLRQIDWSDDRSDGRWVFPALAISGLIVVSAALLMIALKLP